VTPATKDTRQSAVEAPTFRTLAVKLHRNGWVPIPAKGKAPHIKTWLHKSPESLASLRKSQHYADCNIGLRTGEVVDDGWVLAGLDFDVESQEFVEKVVAEAAALQTTAPVRYGRPGRCLLPVAVQNSVSSTTIKLVTPDGEKRSVDLLAKGRMFIAYGTHPDTGGIYAWQGGAPDTLTPQDLPRISNVLEFIEACLPPGWQILKRSTTPYSDDSALSVPIDSAAINDLHEALLYISADDRDTWQRMGHALKTLGEAGRDLWFEWSSTSAKFHAQDAHRVWDSLHPTRTDHRAVFAEAIRCGWRSPKRLPETASEPSAPCHQGASNPLAQGRLALADWAATQHYKDRNPPWIKVYRSLLDDIRFHRLDEAVQATLLPLMLLASETREGHLPGDISVIAFRLRKPETVITNALDQLLRAGFIEQQAHGC
jgi:hypothetical protein